MAGFSAGAATATKKCFEVGYELSKEEYMLDYKENATKLADKINGFEIKIPVKYIKSTDLEKIKSKQKAKDKPADVPSTTPSNT